MASPSSARGTGWNGTAHQQQMPPSEPDRNGHQVRPMGLKVHYTFDKEAKINCLARSPHTIQVQTIALDGMNSIGIIDLRACIRAVSDCSPELASQDCDYTIYAVDYSEPDTPQVGQGMLSWAFDSLIHGDMPGYQPKLVTGRVTRNLLGVFNGGSKETLEVKLRLASSAKPQWQPDSFDMVMTPTGDAEWNSFIQSNPQLGHSQQVSRVASPAVSQCPPITVNRRDSFGSFAPAPQQPSNDVQRIAPVPVEPTIVAASTQASSRPSSRTSNRAPRKRGPTGRPRGRPRKKPAAEGNTSGYEDGTEGEDAPAKKRVKTTTADKVTTNPFVVDPESLRVAASTSGSLRSFRPVAVNNKAGADNHLQEVPRAPTPVPNGQGPALSGRFGKIRRESNLGQNSTTCSTPTYADGRSPLSVEDGRSPESLAPTPIFSEDSPPDISSSPPVQRAASFFRSSLPPSSPVLPPMPRQAKVPQDANLACENSNLLEEKNVPTLEQQPVLPKPARRSRSRKVEPNSSSSVPIQVFQMQDGPRGQDMVHICSYNSTYPSTSYQLPPHLQQAQKAQPELPELRRDAPLQKSTVGGSTKKERAPSTPAMVPTPPPTTDAAEKPPTPLEEKPSTPWTEKPPTPCIEKPPTPLTEKPESRTKTKEVKRIVPDSCALPATVTDKQRPSSQPPALIAPVMESNEHQTRSQSADPVLLLSDVTDAVITSSVSQTAESEERTPQLQLPTPVRSGVQVLETALPASDPSVPIVSAHGAKLGLCDASMPQSEPIQPVPPSSPPATRSNKNIVKKYAIKQRLEEAIMNGTMPPFCSNCGAIETPTWRKIWTQDRDGSPEQAEYSEKPGRVTAVEILQRDEDDKPTQHRVIKKGLGPADDKASWQESLLCNPCGIWLAKCKTHRPRERWDKDASRLGQERRKRGTGRSKKSRSKAGTVANPTSEAYLHTDALGAHGASSPKYGPSGDSNTAIGGPTAETQETDTLTEAGASMYSRSIPGSTHSAASGSGLGTAKSPIDIELDQAMGSTKRILFPSPRKDSTPKVLGRIDVNIVMTEDHCRQDKMVATEKENVSVVTRDGLLECNDPEALFRSQAIARPCTPPNAKVAAGPLETPHRPVTRSVSKSLRSVRSVSSPSQLLQLQATPSKTPSGRGVGSATLRRSPRNHQNSFDLLDTPISRSINLMLSEPNFGLDSEIDLGSLSELDNSNDALLELELGNFLGTDTIMPSSPPKNGSLSFEYDASWAQWDTDTAAQQEKNE